MLAWAVVGSVVLARRHGVLARGPDVNLGRAEAILQPDPDSEGGQAIRLGLAEIRTIGLELAEQIDAERDRAGPYRDLANLAQRVRLTTPQAEALATAGRRRYRHPGYAP